MLPSPFLYLLNSTHLFSLVRWGYWKNTKVELLSPWWDICFISSLLSSSSALSLFVKKTQARSNMSEKKEDMTQDLANADWAKFWTSWKLRKFLDLFMREFPWFSKTVLPCYKQHQKWKVMKLLWIVSQYFQSQQKQEIPPDISSKRNR